eukprot:UN03330
MSSVIEFRKRTLKLRSRFKKSLKKNTTNEYINQLECKKIQLPFAKHKWCHVINDFLTSKDCTSFINFLYKNRLKQSEQREPTKPRPVSSLRGARPRGLNWTINKNDEISNLIFDRCFNFLPKIWIDENENTIWEICGINNDIKSLKYGPGDVLCAHYDTPYIKNKNEKSFITTVLYLNDDFVGGVFQFINPRNPNRVYPIKIKAGRCLLFQHNTLHPGSAIEKGT